MPPWPPVPDIRPIWNSRSKDSPRAMLSGISSLLNTSAGVAARGAAEAGGGAGNHW